MNLKDVPKIRTFGLVLNILSNRAINLVISHTSCWERGDVLNGVIYTDS